MKQFTLSDLDDLSLAARASPRRRANRNLHDTLDDLIQRLAIAMEPDTVVHPHRHPHTWELLYPLRGRFIVLHFDSAGTVCRRTVLGEDARLVETPAGEWHAVLSLDPGGVIFEVKHGPYAPLPEQDLLRLIDEENPAETRNLLEWYRCAQPGDRHQNQQRG